MNALGPDLVYALRSLLRTPAFTTGSPWGVTPTDPARLATMAAVLLGVTVAASWIPAREAAGVDPVNTLHCE
jgi:hypothetical protein